MPVLQAEEDGQVDVAGQVDPKIVDRDAARDGARRVANREAAAKRSEDLLDRIRRRVRAAQNLRLVRVGRRKVAYANLVPEPSLPVHGRVKWGSFGWCRALEVL